MPLLLLMPLDASTIEFTICTHMSWTSALGQGFVHVHGKQWGKASHFSRPGYQEHTSEPKLWCPAVWSRCSNCPLVWRVWEQEMMGEIVTNSEGSWPVSRLWSWCRSTALLGSQGPQRSSSESTGKEVFLTIDIVTRVCPGSIAAPPMGRANDSSSR